MDYQRHYDALIERARNRKLTGDKERHHAIPRCMGGGNDKHNLVDLTGPEHYVAHQLLCKIYPEKTKLAFAANAMRLLRGNRDPSVPKNKGYGWLRKLHAKAMGDLKRGKTLTPEHKAKVSAGLTGRPVSSETREKISNSNSGKKRTAECVERMAASHRGKTISDEHRAAVSVAHKGKPKSPETKAKMSAANSGKKRSEETKDKLKEIKRRASPLTQEIVDQIRSRYVPRCPVNGSSAMAREFGVSQSVISEILNWKTWA